MDDSDNGRNVSVRELSCRCELRERHTVDELIAQACEARARAYAPYSGFAVGAAIESSDGRTASGCNVENASFGLTVCAERAAVAAAVAAGLSDWRRLVVVVESAEPVAPCGACRQVLGEFCEDLEIVLATTDGGLVKTSLEELLPRRFGRDDLETVQDAQ